MEIEVGTPFANAVAWSPNGKTLATINGYADLSAYNLFDGRSIFRVGHIGYMASNIHFLANDTIAIDATYYPNNVPTWSVAAINIRTGRSTLLDLGRIPEGTSNLFTFSNASATFALSRIIREKDDTGYFISPSPSVIYISSKSRGAIRIFHSSSSDGPVTALSFSATGDLLAAGTSNGWIYIFNVQQSTLIRRYRAYTNDGDQCKALAFSPDGKYLLTGRYNINISGSPPSTYADIWSIKDGKHVTALTPSGEQIVNGNSVKSVTSVDWSSDGARVAVANGNSVYEWGGGIEHFHIINSRLVTQDPNHYGALSLAYSPNGALSYTSNDRISLIGVGR